MGNGRSSRAHTGVEIRGDSIRVSFMWRGRRCRETLRLEATASNLKYAARLRGEILRKIELGTFRYAEYFPDSPLSQEGSAAAKTFKDLAEAWLASGEHEGSTVNGYRKILNGHLYPEFGDEPIARIDFLRIQEVLGRRFTGRSKKTRNNALICIRRPFRSAFIAGIIATNPAERFEYLKTQTPEPDPFEPREVEEIIAKMEELYGEQVANYCGVSFFVGPRPSELIAMAWSEMDWNDRVLRIAKARVLQAEKGTKTSRVRYHELSSRAMFYLERQRKYTQMAGDAIFIDPVTGQPYIDERPFRRRYWQPVLKLLGIRYRVPYQMRHTYATTAIMAGANPVWIARQMGNSPRVMFKHYGRWIEKMDRSRQRNLVDQFLGQNWDKTAGETGGSGGDK